jgi:hypothetical protein
MKVNNIGRVVEVLWPRLQEVLRAFAEEIAVNDPTLIIDIGRSANDAFPLRAYLAFRRHADGEEFAVAIDVQSNDQQITIESDVSLDDGKVICSGPSTTVATLADMRNLENSIDDWMREFEPWLIMSAPVITMNTSQLR